MKLFKFEFSRRTRNIFRIVLISMAVLLIIYVVGLITHAIALFSHKTQTPINFNPIVEVFQFTFNFELSKFVWLAVGILLFVIIVYMLSFSDKRGKMDNSKKSESANFEYSEKETYGSAREMTEKDIRDFFTIVPPTLSGIGHTGGDIVFGFLNDNKKELVAMPKRDWKKGTDYNGNIAVCGPPGTGKSRAFVMNYVLSKVVAGESLFVVDTKGEIYARIYNFVKRIGYETKILNLIETDRSDGWDILGEVENNPEMATELAATVIRNTGGSKSDPFWNDAEQNILKAVILLKSIGQTDISNPSGRKQTLGDVYKYIATRKVTRKEGKGDSMEADFGYLQEHFPNHPAITPFLQFMNAGDDLCKKILHGLANRLQLFQDPQLCATLGTKDIDILKAGTEKCIYFLRFSDQTSTYSFITALFFSFVFVKLVGYADTHGGELPVPVNIVADEFINIGTIQDFEKKISTARSRRINILIIYQSNMLFESAYPNGLWEAILADCDTFVVLGVGNELTTAEFVSDMTGEATAAVSSNSIAISSHEMRSTSSTGKRNVKTANEVKRLKKKYALVFIRDQNVAQITKMDYTENPIYLANKDIFREQASVAEHITKVDRVDIDYANFRVNAESIEDYKRRSGDMPDSTAPVGDNQGTSGRSTTPYDPQRGGQDGSGKSKGKSKTNRKPTQKTNRSPNMSNYFDV